METWIHSALMLFLGRVSRVHKEMNANSIPLDKHLFVLITALIIQIWASVLIELELWAIAACR
jgi:hypothetical protein